MSFKTSLLIAVILEALAILAQLILRLGESQDWPVMHRYNGDNLRSWLYFLVTFFQSAGFLFFFIGLYRKASRGV